MVLGGQLERASTVAEGPRFTIKGAVALEMRLRAKARATRDIDLVVDEEGGRDIAQLLDEALEGSYQDFMFRVKGEPHVMPNGSLRFQVALEHWSTEGEAGAPSSWTSRAVKATRRKSSSSIRWPWRRLASKRHRRFPVFHCVTTWRRRSMG